MSSSKLKKIVVTPEEVANTPSRRVASRPKTPAQQVLEVTEAGDGGGGGVTLIQVNELGEVAAVDGSILGPEIAIQITDEVTPENVVESEMIEGVDPTGVPEGDVTEESDNLVIQSPEDYKRKLLEDMYENLIKYTENYSDLPIFCSDGVIWSNKLLLSAASPFIKDLLLDVHLVDSTCLIIPHMTKKDFTTFQATIFSKEETLQSDMFSVIRGCEIFRIDSGEVSTEQDLKGDLPDVDYANMIANPFEKKRIFRSLGYLTENNNNKENEPNLKGAGPVIRVFQDNFKCPECDRTFFDATAYENHQKAIHSSYSIDQLVPNKDHYKCTDCHRTFGYAVNLKKHIWFCHSKTGAQLKSLSSQALRMAIPLPTKEEKLNEKYEDMKCSLCGKFSTNWKGLELHMLSHANEKPFKCSLCGKGFKDEQKLKRHGVVHTKEKAFECSYPGCKKRFGLKHNLKVHEKGHSGVGKTPKARGRPPTSKINIDPTSKMDIE